ncbi:hypothetical protein [Taklimakanibacter deserti]|uniref:hypothetical protein n=1 Tax=Taklimakanibacter deserti TaxID=2267839 RepID=UPI0013C4E23C
MKFVTLTPDGVSMITRQADPITTVSVNQGVLSASFFRSAFVRFEQRHGEGEADLGHAGCDRTVDDVAVEQGEARKAGS